MKPTNNRYLTSLAFAAAVTTTSINAQTPFPAPTGINLNLKGEIIQSPVIHEPSQNGVDWLYPGANLANRIVPVGQFTGYEDDGTAIPDLDLIPLKPASITLGGTTINDFSQITGTPGKDGKDGKDGVNGTNGTDGLPGKDGMDGTNGLNGTNGIDGKDGEDGAPGVIQTASNGLYLSGNDVRLGGSLIQHSSIDMGTYNLTFGTGSPSGFIGIGPGMNSPRTPLHVNGTVRVAAQTATSGNFGSGTSNIPGVEISPAGNIAVQNSGLTGNIYLSKPAGAAAGDQYIQFYAGGTYHGGIYYTAGGVGYATTSDERLKENFSTSVLGLDTVLKIQVSDYNYKSDASKTREVGFIAQQIRKVVPQVVKVGGEDPSKDPWTVDYGRLTPVLTKAIQEQQVQIEALKAENAKLTAAVAKMDVLEKAVAALEGKSNGTVAVSLK